MKEYHYIYKITNLLNMSYYIGMHSTDNIDDGYFGSGVLLSKSLKKYGKDNFSFDIIRFAKNRIELKGIERDIVNEDLIKDTLCMNLQEGGSSGFDYIKMKRDSDPEYDKWYRREQSIRLKRTHSEGKIEYNTFEGRNHKEESKLKMKGHKRQDGNKNSQFGTCWIYNEVTSENKKIKKQDISTYLLSGWVKGRKMVP